MKTILKVVAQTTTQQVKLIGMSWLDKEVGKSVNLTSLPPYFLTFILLKPFSYANTYSSNTHPM